MATKTLKDLFIHCTWRKREARLRELTTWSRRPESNSPPVDSDTARYLVKMVSCARARTLVATDNGIITAVNFPTPTSIQQSDSYVRR